MLGGGHWVGVAGWGSLPLALCTAGQETAWTRVRGGAVKPWSRHLTLRVGGSQLSRSPPGREGEVSCGSDDVSALVPGTEGCFWDSDQGSACCT